MSQYFHRKRFNSRKFLRFVFFLVIVTISVGTFKMWRNGWLPVVALLYQGGPASPEEELLEEPSEALPVEDEMLAEADELPLADVLEEIALHEPDTMTSAAPQSYPTSGQQVASDGALLAVQSMNLAVTQANGSLSEAADNGSVSEETKSEPMPLVVTHTVSTGETLWDIARKYNVAMDTIIVANQLTNIHRLRVGQVLRVPTRDGVLYTVRSGDSLWTIARRFNVDANQVARENNLSDPSRLRAGQELFIPGMAAVEASRYQLVGPDGKLRAAFLRPVSGGWISSRFGQRWGRLHAGVDIAVSVGTPVRAAADGVVTFSGRNGGYGLLVTIDHGENVETRYAHNSRLVVKKGQKVKAGQVIAYSGNTGNSTGPHVHFEIRLKGKPYDPLKYIRQ